jgi:hypothetical protein
MFDWLWILLGYRVWKLVLKQDTPCRNSRITLWLSPRASPEEVQHCEVAMRDYETQGWTVLHRPR